MKNGWIASEMKRSFKPSVSCVSWAPFAASICTLFCTGLNRRSRELFRIHARNGFRILSGSGNWFGRRIFWPTPTTASWKSQSNLTMIICIFRPCSKIFAPYHRAIFGNTGSMEIILSISPFDRNVYSKSGTCDVIMEWVAFIGLLKFPVFCEKDSKPRINRTFCKKSVKQARTSTSGGAAWVPAAHSEA